MMRAVEVRRWGMSLAACAVLVWAAAVVVCRSAADVRFWHSRSTEDLERACRADPGRASCWARLAEARESLGLEGSGDWCRSIGWNPREAPVLTQAALAAEARGDTQRAEALLLEAETYNRLWLPRWTLANFYFRHNRTREFWAWMRAAFERSYGDPTAAFRLCMSAGANTEWLLDNILPPAPEILHAFVDFLLRDRRYDALPGAAVRYLAHAPADEQSRVTATLTAAADALLSANRPEGAIQVWNELAERGYIPYPPWSPEAPLINGRFQTPLPAPALDWRTPQDQGVMAIFGTPLDGVKISFSGQQSTDAELLTQFLVLQPSQRYRFGFDYQTREITSDDSALRWRLTDVKTGEPYEIPSLVLAGDDWDHVSIRFDTGSGPGLRVAKLALIAGRKQGHARMRGEVWLRHVRLEAY